MTPTCGGDQRCNGYCDEVLAKCPDDFGDANECCKFCSYLEGHTDPNNTFCCRVGALNTDMPDAAACTLASPLGTNSKSAATCGNEAASACALYQKACSKSAACLSACTTYWSAKPPTDSFARSLFCDTDTIQCFESKSLDALADPSKCAGPTMMINATSCN